MARPDRSLSPADSHASSRRSYRPRSRSPDRPHRSARDPRDLRDRRDPRDDHYYSRRHDRRDDDSHRSGRRDRSRERDRHDRDDRRYRARESDYRGPSRPDDSRSGHRLPRDDIRDPARLSRDDLREPGRLSRREDTVANPPRSPRPPPTASSNPATATAAATAAKADKTEEQKRAERLVKLEEWKKKNAADKQRQRREQIEKADPINKQREADAKAAAQSGKFDPKAIAKMVTGSSNNTSAALGGDIHISKAEQTNGALLEDSVAESRLKKGSNINGFNFGGARAQPDSDKAAARTGLDLGEESAQRRKLEKLPSPPPDDAVNETSMLDTANGQESDMIDDSEEESAAAARAALEKREQQRLADGETAANGSKDDVVMAEASKEAATQAEDDVDPLDAFMADLAASNTKVPGPSARQGKKPQQESILLEADDEFATMEATNADDLFDLSNKPKKRREVVVVDHSKMDYTPFRKDFYVEPSEVASMTAEEVSDLRLLLDGIKVRGANPPKPVTKWSHLGMGVQSLEVIEKLGYDKPTSIQAQAIPAIMSGRDVIGIAKTGSGKTVSFLLPMFRHIKDQPPLASQDGPIGLILAPTRELVNQIHKDCKPWLKALNLRATACYGGAPIKDQIAELKRGAEIVIATAGRMIDLLAANSGRVTNLKRTTYVVLDEADRMFDMGFEPQVMKIMNNIRPTRQTVMFSATFPKQMEALARKVLTKPIEIQVGGRSTVAPEIEQVVEVRNDGEKFGALLHLLPRIHENDEDARTLIFVDRQEAAEDLMNSLMKRGYPSNSLHGGKDQSDRDDVITSYKAGYFPVLVATSVAARGLDVKQLKLVVNYDCPNHLEDYVHRVGRTGRAGNKGLAVTYITESQDRFARDIAKALEMSGKPIPEDLQKLVESFAKKVEAGKENRGSAGFGGRGIERYDEQRTAQLNRERNAYGQGEVVEAEKEQQGDDESSDVKVVAKGQGEAKEPEKKISETFTVHKRELQQQQQQPAAKNSMQGVTDAVAAINARLRKSGDIRHNAPIDNKGPDAGAFHATLEINDYPQKARWAVTNRTNVAKILDATGTSITSKGNFYPEGTTPGPGQLPKLYLLVEGDTEKVVTDAMTELIRLLKGAVEDAAASDARAPAKGGRYSVL